MRNTILLLGGSLGALLLAGAVVVVGSVMLVKFAGVDTTDAPAAIEPDKLTPANFQQITAGMDLGQVTELVGAPHRLHREAEMSGRPYQVHVWRVPNYEYTVALTDGQVTAAHYRNTLVDNDRWELAAGGVE